LEKDVQQPAQENETTQRKEVTFSSPEPRLIFLGCGGVIAGSLLWSEGWIRVFAGVVMGIGWALIALGLVRLMRRRGSA
jgi:hypothetical protein